MNFQPVIIVNYNPYTDSKSVWHELSLREKGGGTFAIQIHLHRSALQELQKIPWSGTPLVKDACSTYGFQTFSDPQEGDCGFENCFTLVPSDDLNWIVWEFEFPKLNARDRAKETPFLRVHALRVTFRAFLYSGLRWFEGDTQCHQRQLMLISGMALPGKQGGRGTGDIAVILTSDAVDWLNDPHSAARLAEAEQSMRKANAFLCEGAQRNERFGVSFRNNWLTLNVPGDASYINGESQKPEKGFELTGHNLDSATQQFTLLAGLAKLHDLMRAQ